MAAKAKQVFTVEYIELQDGTKVEVRPLPIKKLKRAQALINDAINGQPEAPVDEDDDNAVETEDEDDSGLLDAFIATTLMVMENQKDETYRQGCAKFLDEETGRDELEDVIDQETLYEIVKVSTGYDFLAVQKRMQQMMERELNL